MGEEMGRGLGRWRAAVGEEGQGWRRAGGGGRRG